MLKDKVVFTIADQNNEPYARLLEKSFHFFHPEVEFRVYTENKGVPDFFYKATPFIARDLLKEYELVVKIDADSIITGPLDDVFNDTSYDFGVVLNNNRREPLVTCLNVPTQNYANCGFVAMRSRDAVEHWWKLCCRGWLFNQFQMREQDLLNTMILYGDYNIVCFDEGSKWYGLKSKSEWARFKIQRGKLMCESDPTYNTTKEICCIHAAGGNTEKWNWPKQFSPEVVAYLKKITE